MRSFRVALLVLVLGCDAASDTSLPSDDSSALGAVGLNDAGTSADQSAPSNDAAMDADQSAEPEDAGIEVLHRSCTFDPLPADWSLEPGWECSSVPGSLGRLECVAGIHCTHSEQCSAQPFGRCLGYGRTTCDYGLAMTLCSADADCTTLPDGRCVPSLIAGERCFPSGECEPVGPYCLYPELQDDCAQDSDCSSLANGRCVRAVTHSSCQYNNQCAIDDDCLDAERCACTGGDLWCVPADCTADEDCPSGERCEQISTCAGYGIAGYHCTSPNDECGDDDDCGGGVCRFDDNTGSRSCAPPCLVP